MKAFERKCSATGVGMNEGFVFRDGEMYFSTEELLIKHLRSLGDEDYNNVSDEFLLSEAYMVGDYYYTTWDSESD